MALELFDAFQQKNELLQLMEVCARAPGVRLFIGEESGFTPAATEVEDAGIPQKIQCVTSITPFIGAASVSCMITAKLAVLFGGLVQESAGEAALGSAHEYCVGIMEPSAYAELVNLNLEGGGGAACCCAATPATPATIRNARTVSNRTDFIRIAFPPQVSFLKSHCRLKETDSTPKVKAHAQALFELHRRFMARKARGAILRDIRSIDTFTPIFLFRRHQVAHPLRNKGWIGKREIW